MQTYSLDVAFSSDTNYDGQPIAMAYGFVGSDGTDQGQTPGIIVPGADFQFAVFDSAETPGTVTGIQIIFGEGVTPFVDGNNNPVPSPYNVPTVPSPVLNETSKGCNVTGAMWALTDFVVRSDIPNGTPFECTVTVNVTDSQNNTKVFSVDPEVIVEGGN